MKKLLSIIFVISMTVVGSSCSIIFDEVPANYTDGTIIPLEIEINTIQDAFQFAHDKACGLGVKVLKSQMIEVYFEKEQIQTQRGELNYNFCADDGKNNSLAEITVTVDMESNTVTSISSWYDERTKSKRLPNGYLTCWDNIKDLDISKWTISLDDAFDIIYETIGEDAFSRFDEPKIEVNCFQDSWKFIITEGNYAEAPIAVKYIIDLDPINGKVVESIGF
ncbi:MAG: hypothetical protein LBV08_10800 [Clostridiales bacterium]|jgi:hypothetical protein|nr:hypothetical protein [Clostridiales bacterium]